MSTKDKCSMGGGEMQTFGDGEESIVRLMVTEDNLRLQPHLQILKGKTYRCSAEGYKNPRRRKILIALAERDGGWHCHYCGVALLPATNVIAHCKANAIRTATFFGEFYFLFEYPVFAVADHIIPRAHGGGNSLDNLVMACDCCNGERGDLPYPEYLLKIEKRAGGAP